MRRGDIILCKGGRFPGVSWWLARILKLFEPDWDGWGWHLAIAYMEDKQGWWMLEATSKGVVVSLIGDREHRVYRWLDKEPSKIRMYAFFNQVQGARYDYWVYAWTVLQYLGKKIGLSLPRIVDRRYTCWEMAMYAMRESGKPVLPIWDYPVLTDILKVLA